MRIAIFGDSFADQNNAAKFNNDAAWPTLLEQRGIKVHNYAQAGSSLYFSWKKYYSFKRSPVWNVCDAVIFVITEPGREIAIIDNKTYFLTSTSKHQLEFLKQQATPNSRAYTLFDSIYNYWAYIKDPEQENLFHELLTEKIKSEPKIFYIDAFGSSSAFMPDTQLSLIDISMRELRYWRPELQSYEDNFKFMRNYRDARQCHFSAENNLMIANKVHEALLGKSPTVQFSVSDFVQPSASFEKYFIPVTDQY